MITGSFALAQPNAPRKPLSPEEIEVMKKKGASVEWVALEPIYERYRPMAIASTAPHPNAAKLFINWLYSQEGMQLCVDTVSIMAIRDGIAAPEKVKAISPAISDVKSIPMDWKSLTPEILTKFRNESVEIFGK